MSFGAIRPHVARFRGTALVYLLFTLAVFVGCSKGGPSNEVPKAAFDSAPTEAKQLWTDSLAAWKNQQYSQAATALTTLESKSANLSPEQLDALAKAKDAFGQQVLAAADSGNASAGEAIKILRAGSGRRGAGSR